MPSTYTLNNGIELIGTGEQSGTWGDTTNTNLELLDTALDGQVSVTLAATGSSGSPNTLPISDGASSNGRNRLVIFGDGGDLGGTAFVQLTPNDAEKIIYVRNNLSGSRSILLFQGTYSASNDYEVPAGTTAVVFFNGAGTGAVAANVFNNAFFDSLRLGGVSVDKILDEDNMASDDAAALATQQSIKAYVDSQVGTVDTLAEILANGNTSGGTNIQMTTTDELQFRDTALTISSSADGQLDIDADTEIEIVAPTVDIDASTAMTIDTAALTVTGAVDLNTSLNVDGTVTSDGLTVAGNVSVDGGSIKLDGNYPNGTGNVALGNNAGDALASGGNYNVALGNSALSAVTTGDQNVAIGNAALQVSTASSNVAVGYLAGGALITGSSNVALGVNALNDMVSGSNNTVIGKQAGDALGNEIVATAIVSGLNYTIQTLGTTDFTLIGASSNTVGGTFTATGAGSGTGTASANANYNTFVGHQSGDVIVGGSKNSILGRFDGNQGGLDIRNSDNHIVLSDGDGNPRLYFDDSGNMAVDTDTLYVDSTNDRVGVNVSSPVSPLQVSSGGNGNIIHANGASNAWDFILKGTNDGDTESVLYELGMYRADGTTNPNTVLKFGRGLGEQNGFFTIDQNGSEAMRIDSSRRVLIGTDSTRGTYGLTVAEPSDGIRVFGIASGGMDAIHFDQARGSVASPTASNADGDGSYLSFSSYDGTNFDDIGSLAVVTDGAQDAGRMIFRTTPTGGSQTERMRIHSSGDISMSGSSGTVGTLKGRGSLTISDDHGDNTGGAVAFHYTGNGGYSEIYVENTNTLVLNADPTEAGSNTSIKFRTDDELAAMIDSSQRVLIGSTSGTNSVTPLNLKGATGGVSGNNFVAGKHGDSNFQPAYTTVRSRGSEVSPTSVADDDGIAAYNSYGYDGNSYIYTGGIQMFVDGTPGTNDMPSRLSLYTTSSGAASATERVRITKDGNIGIGGVDPVNSANYKTIDVRSTNGGQIILGRGSNQDFFIYSALAGNTIGSGTSSGYLRFMTNSSGSSNEAMRIDSSQRVLMGAGTDATSTITNGWWNGSTLYTGILNVQNVNDGTAPKYVSVAVSRHSNDAEAGQLGFAKSRGSTANSKTTVGVGDGLGIITFQGADGGNLVEAARISGSTDNTAASDDMPGRLQFYTTSSGAASPTERMRINNSGRVTISGAAGNLDAPTSLMGDMNAYLRVGNSGAQIGTLIKYSHGPNTNVDGAVFQLRTGSNGNAAYLKITCTNYQGARESIFFANNASGTWNVTEVNVADYGGNSPNFTVTTGTTNPTVTVSLPNTSYSGGFLDVSASNHWQLTLA